MKICMILIYVFTITAWNCQLWFELGELGLDLDPSLVALMRSQVSPRALAKWSSTDRESTEPANTSSLIGWLISFHLSPRDLAKWSSTVPEKKNVGI